MKKLFLVTAAGLALVSGTLFLSGCDASQVAAVPTLHVQSGNTSAVTMSPDGALPEARASASATQAAAQSSAPVVEVTVPAEDTESPTPTDTMETPQTVSDDILGNLAAAAAVEPAITDPEAAAADPESQSAAIAGAFVGTAPGAGADLAAIAAESEKGDLLRRGSKGERVRLVQQYLNNLGYLDAAPTGMFGAETEEAVRAFQQRNSLVDDGIVGNSTWAVLQTTTAVGP